MKRKKAHVYPAESPGTRIFWVPQPHAGQLKTQPQSMARLPILQMGLNALLGPCTQYRVGFGGPKCVERSRMALRCYLLQFWWDGIHVRRSQPLHKQLNSSSHDSCTAAETHRRASGGITWQAQVMPLSLRGVHVLVCPQHRRQQRRSKRS